MATRPAESVVRLCLGLPIQRVADFYGPDWDTVKALDMAALRARAAGTPTSTPSSNP